MNREKFETSMSIRRDVLGGEYVDKAVDATTDFTHPFQQMVTENCWGEVWAREGLPRKTRSLITIATLAALKSSTELKLHVTGAMRNGCTVAEIQEVLLHSTVYCGMPSGIEAFRAAKEAIEIWQQGPGN
jgi:4-carboxymuconolactone decarboxylase